MNIAIVIINTTFAIISTLFAGRAIYLSYLSDYKIRLNSVAWLMQSDKVIYAIIVRCSLFSAFIIDLLMVTYGIIRIVLHFPPYLNNWIKITSTIVQLGMLCISFINMFAYDKKLSDKLLPVLANYRIFKLLIKKNK